MLTSGSVDAALDALGEVLAARELAYEVVAVGGSGLMLLGLLDRPTRDIDVLAVVDGAGYRKANPLPDPLVEAARDVGETLGLGPDWVSPGPTDLLDFGLPNGFETRVETRTFGSLTVHLASRLDQLFFKLYAAVDQGVDSKHFQDLQRLSPQRDELLQAASWSRTHDPSPGYRSVLVQMLQQLGVEDADAVV